MGSRSKAGPTGVTIRDRTTGQVITQDPVQASYITRYYQDKPNAKSWFELPERQRQGIVQGVYDYGNPAVGRQPSAAASAAIRAGREYKGDRTRAPWYKEPEQPTRESYTNKDLWGDLGGGMDSSCTGGSCMDEPSVFEQDLGVSPDLTGFKTFGDAGPDFRKGRGMEGMLLSGVGSTSKSPFPSKRKTNTLGLNLGPSGGIGLGGLSV
jgi:hypothetical protein